ncbi:MAG: hypothetical protein ABIV39_13340 [Verrucomicrobiota bacterium]
MTETTASGTRTLLENCTFWTNQIYQRTPQSGNFDFIETSTPALCKMVQISWVCSGRATLGITNSESVHSMKIVMRKKPD